MKIKQIRINSFKNINYIEIPLDDVTLLVGGNNSGKSSIIQGIHFAISCLRSTKIYGKSANSPATTLGLNQFSYLPTHQIMELNHSNPMTQSEGPRFDFWYDDSSGAEERFSLSLYRGKNSNVSLTYKKDTTLYAEASELVRPFSVYVPGLAGIPLVEERRANAIVQTGIAQGDANLFLRNVLHRLEQEPVKKQQLESLMRRIFPNFSVKTYFDENINQYISSRVHSEGLEIPLEMVGTGCLQALQLSAYVILYRPELLLLDEPDAHLHPGNQKLLIDLLFSLSETTGTQIVLASHSRHVFDAIQNNPLGTFHWIHEGLLVEDREADVGLLLELGALDKYEEIKKRFKRILVFTEDEKSRKLKTILESNGWDLQECEFVSYNGVDNFEATKVVVEHFLSVNEDSIALIYRDGDGMSPKERQWAIEQYEKIIPDRAVMFISQLTDIEHPFCQPSHIAEVCAIDEMEAFDIVNDVVRSNQAILASKFTSKRHDIKFKILKKYNDRESTEKLIGSEISFHYSLGKILLPKIEAALSERGIFSGSLIKSSTALQNPDLNFANFAV